MKNKIVALIALVGLFSVASCKGKTETQEGVKTDSTTTVAKKDSTATTPKDSVSTTK